MEAQHRAFGQALVGVEVEPHAGGRQHPRRRLAVDQLAAAVGGAAHDHAVAADEVDPLGAPAGLRAADVEARREEVALLVLGLQVQLAAEEAVVAALQQHLAAGAHAVVGLAVFEPVGLQGQQAALQLHLALGDQGLAGAPAQALGLDVDLVIVGRHPHDRHAQPLRRPGRRARPADGGAVLLCQRGARPATTQPQRQQAGARPGRARERQREAGGNGNDGHDRRGGHRAGVAG